MANTNLKEAKAAKNDEFYTQLVDIENELKYYRPHFQGKVVYCNCDNCMESNFFKYFALSFERLGLKELIATAYNENGKGIVYRYKGDKNGNNYPDFDEIVPTELNGNGDFRSAECIEILKECDIVVTNPPFSLFREYVAQLIEYGKQFLIIGNCNAITYKEIFPYIKENKLWLGVSSFNNGMYFQVPNDYEYSQTYKFDKERNGKKVMRVSSIAWFTNLDHHRRNLELDLYMKYSNEYYPKYYNFDAIEVSKVCEIPMDYKGVIGVPITFLDKYNPNQFEIIGLGIANLGLSIGVQPYTEEHRKYRKEIQKRGVVNGDLYLVENGLVKVPYARILIKHKNN